MGGSKFHHQVVLIHDLTHCAGSIDWSEAPGAFPGAYQTVRDGNEEGGYH